MKVCLWCVRWWVVMCVVLMSEGGKLPSNKLLVEHKHFVLVTEVIWKVLVSWYCPGTYSIPALPRTVSQTLFICHGWLVGWSSLWYASLLAGGSRRDGWPLPNLLQGVSAHDSPPSNKTLLSSLVSVFSHQQPWTGCPHPHPLCPTPDGCWEWQWRRNSSPASHSQTSSLLHCCICQDYHSSRGKLFLRLLVFFPFYIPCFSFAVWHSRPSASFLMCFGLVKCDHTFSTL